MTGLPPRRSTSSTSRDTRHGVTPLQVLLQMGFPRHRALKALGATGYRSVQLASDWLLTHVNDAYLDIDEPREYIFYATPTGPLLNQLQDFWEKSQKICGWNGAHNFPPHVTMVPFFKAPDDVSLQLATAVKQVVESEGAPPSCPMKLKPYVSHNFMGLFVSEDHAEYLKKISAAYVKQVKSTLGLTLMTTENYVANNSSFGTTDNIWTCFPWYAIAHERTGEKSVTPEAQNDQSKSLHITLAYHFDFEAYDQLKQLVDELQLAESSCWELRLYSRDARFANHVVHRVEKSYKPKASDELELVDGDYLYIDQKEIDTSPDGWVHGTSWLTGISGYIPAVYTKRTAESDAWTLHRAIAVGHSEMSESKSVSEASTDSEPVQQVASEPSSEQMPVIPVKSEESTKLEWTNYWDGARRTKIDGILDIQYGKYGGVAFEDFEEDKSRMNQHEQPGRRYVMAMRHGERVDLTYGRWTHRCFDKDGNFIRKDLNMPITLTKRQGGADSYDKDCPLTRIGRYQAYLVGEGLRLANFTLKYIYASNALRSVETAHEVLQGLAARDPKLKIRVEPGLFEFKMWHQAKGLAPFMTRTELHRYGLNVDHSLVLELVKVEPGLFEFKMWHQAKGLAPFMTKTELHRYGLNVDHSYRPYVELDVTTPETMQEFFDRNMYVMQSAYKDTKWPGGNILFVGHAATIDLMVLALRDLDDIESKRSTLGGRSIAGSRYFGKTPVLTYAVSQSNVRVPYCSLGAMKDKPFQIVQPPCPPCINTGSGRYNWKILYDLDNVKSPTSNQ